MSVIAEFQGEHHYSKYGWEIESLDFNHDGYTDLIVLAQAYGYQVGIGGARGKVYIYYGGPNFNSSTSPSITLDYSAESHRRIRSVVNVGDVNGDGFEDLCITTYVLNVPGSKRILLFWGATDTLDNPDHVIPIDDDYFESYPVRRLGDLDGDGFDDVSLEYVTPTAPLIIKYIIVWGGSLTEQVVLEQPYNNAQRSICGIGDINGDGYKDFALGHTDPDPYTGYHMIRIYYGNPARDLSSYDVLIQTQAPITKTSKPIGDVNGDGFADFMGFYSNAGMHAWLGGTNINYSLPSFNFTPGWMGHIDATGLKYGDLNGDGFDDVIGTNIYERKFSVWMGRTQMNGTSDLIIPRDMDYFGWGIASGDFNADGYCDVAISAPEPQYSTSPNFPGNLWIYGGNALLSDTTVGNEDEHTPQVSELIRVNISPNPVRTSEGSVRVSVRIKDPSPIKEGSISIFNIKGQLVYSNKIPLVQSGMEHDLSLRHCPSGIYLCKVSVGKISTTKKIQVLK
jgi:hypothetical protein